VISSSDDLAGHFSTFASEAFRLEILDAYNIPSSAEHIRAFLAGEPQPDDFRENSWVDTVRDATRGGKRMYRVHILSRPLTDYLRYELGWGYTRNAEAGEEFFILDTTEQPNPLPEAPDFWLFDERTPAVMHYDATGAFTGPEILGPDRAAEFVAYRDTALAHAVPFAEWWAKYGG
jgi:hypothetical protein